MLTRRALLRETSLIALAPTVPAFLSRSVRGLRGGTAGHVLVVVQLDGGNDGLNTVVPYADELYPRVRPTLRVASDRVLKLDDSVGLHPALKSLAALHERGELAVVQGVGYPNPNRSHDVSMAIWHTARFEREEQKGHGWLGRALDGGAPPPAGVPSAVLAGADPLPAALFARRAVSASVNALDEYASTQLGALDERAPRADEGIEDYLRRTTLEARGTVERLRALARARGGAKYPSTELARRLALVAELVKAGLETPVYYVVQRGYDTHSLQADVHARLLAELGDAVLAFREDLGASELSERVLLLTFSEFGRRVEENASFGTDHGTANAMFLAGPAVAGGAHGTAPSLADLDDGDLKMSLDFRAVYATVLEGWLGLASETALAGAFEPRPLLRT